MSKEESEEYSRTAYFPKTKLDYYTFRKLRSLKSRQIGDKGWDEWFKYQVRDVMLSPSLHERVQQGTAATLLAVWMQNFADNLPYIRYGDKIKMETPKEYHQQTIADLVKPPPLFEGVDEDYAKWDAPSTEFKGMKVKNPCEGSAIIVGRGPSLFEHKHCKVLAEAVRDGKYSGLVITTDGGLIPCLEAQLLPDIIVTVDGSPTIKKYFDHPLVQEHGSKMKWIVSVTVSNEVYLAARKAGIQTYWFNPMFDDWRQNESWTKLQRLQSRTNEFPRGIPTMQSGGNCGAAAWICAMEIFKRSPIVLIGIDFGYPEGTKLEETQYYSSVLREAKGDVAIIREAYKEFYHPTFKTKAYVDLVFYHYRQAFLEMQQTTAMWYRLYGGTINCSEGGTLWGQGIECMTFKNFLEKYPK